MSIKQRNRRKLIEKATLLYKEVYKVSFFKIKDAQVAQDIAQDVLEIAIHKIDTLRDPEALKAWVMKITENEIKGYFKKLEKYRSHENVWGLENDLLFSQIEDTEGDILAGLTAKESRHNVVKALLQLESKYQEVIREHLIYEWTLDEIAEKKSINPNTVRSRYFRGIKLLKDAFERIEKGGDFHGK